MSLDKTILVVDDDPAVLEMICEGLIDHGFDVVSAMSPEEALEKIHKKEVSFGLLDIDLGSPNMNGIQLGQKLRAENEDLIILIMTGYHNIGLAVDALRTYRFDYMIKPFRVDQIVLLMERSETELMLRRENRRLRAKITELETEMDEMRKRMEMVMPAGTEVRLKKGENAKIQSERAVKSYLKQK